MATHTHTAAASKCEIFYCFSSFSFIRRDAPRNGFEYSEWVCLRSSSLPPTTTTMRGEVDETLKNLVCCERFSGNCEIEFEHCRCCCMYESAGRAERLVDVLNDYQQSKRIAAKFKLKSWLWLIFQDCINPAAFRLFYQSYLIVMAQLLSRLSIDFRSSAVIRRYMSYAFSLVCSFVRIAATEWNFKLKSCCLKYLTTRTRNRASSLLLCCVCSLNNKTFKRMVERIFESWNQRG